MMANTATIIPDNVNVVGIIIESSSLEFEDDLGKVVSVKFQ
jgi:hypothetical protein